METIICTVIICIAAVVAVIFIGSVFVIYTRHKENMAKINQNSIDGEKLDQLLDIYNSMIDAYNNAIKKLDLDNDVDEESGKLEAPTIVDGEFVE